jgi:hypothetical protein
VWDFNVLKCSEVHELKQQRRDTDRMLYIRHISGQEWEYNGALNHLFIEFKETFDSVGRGFYVTFLLSIVLPCN